MTYYIVLAKGHAACHGGTFIYDAPKGKRPGEWTPRITDISACGRRYSVYTIDHLAKWLYATSHDPLPLEIWECEVEGAVEADSKYDCERIRLTRLVGTLDEYDLCWLGTIFAERVLCNTDDPRVGDCILAVREYTLGLLDADGLSAARIAAWSAAESARSAALSAAESARGAAESAAWSAQSARIAAESAGWSTWSEAQSAWSAAWSAVGQDIIEYLREGAM